MKWLSVENGPSETEWWCRTPVPKCIILDMWFRKYLVMHFTPAVYTPLFDTDGQIISHCLRYHFQIKTITLFCDDLNSLDVASVKVECILLALKVESK